MHTHTHTHTQTHMHAHIHTIIGTNDKAGGPSYMLKWVSPVAIKETFVPYTDWGYPSMDK